MNKKIEWLIIIFLLVVLVNLSSCAKKIEQTNIQQSKVTVANSTDKKEVLDKTKEPTTGVSNIPNIIEALTCMFSPDTCEERKQEQAMDR